MSTKFFNNEPQNTLFEKFKGIAEYMNDFYSFLAVVGYFRSSGYFKLRKELENVKKIQILVGINVDSIFLHHDKAMLMLGKEDEAKEIFSQEQTNDVKYAKYEYEVERGIIQFCDDIKSGKLEIKIHPSKNIHAKFYLCLPEAHTPNSDGWVIMGSSNISDSGLGLAQSPRYELNVAMKDYDDVNYCHEEFKKLWEEAIPITADDVAKNIQKTHLRNAENIPTPYELYMKVLIDSFGSQVEDDFTMSMPDNVMELKYQTDAVIQGYQMLCKHNGFFLADVVGLGKTIVATMIAKRFVEANGGSTKILVIYPPALEKNWKETFKKFGITKKTQFVSNGSLDKVLDGKNNYHSKEEFDLIIVDEAHNFRSDTAIKYDELQKICKSPRPDDGLVPGSKKKVMLLSATPLNNRPSDLRNLILLFEDVRQCTIEGISNINTFFATYEKDYKDLMSRRESIENKEANDAINKQIEKLYEELRTNVFDKITIRRTRNNINNDSHYKADLDKAGIKFPIVSMPETLEYKMNSATEKLFIETLDAITNQLTYARYRAIEFMNGEFKEKYKNAELISKNLANIFKIHLVKRLESSFYAFCQSINNFVRITQGMIDMFNEGRIIIAPQINVRDMQKKEWTIDAIIEYAENKGFETKEIIFAPENFADDFLPMLKKDLQILTRLKNAWSNLSDDPKLDLFIEKMQTTFFNKQQNKSGKIVIFSESVDTVNYLAKEIKNKLKRDDVLSVSAENRRGDFDKIRLNFDANINKDEQENKYNIIITSDVLAEGVNLHRSNVIINYDSPWNATRLMQRIGRVNRIGSVADNIQNYMFYPSIQGDAQIKLYQNVLIKLQGFHAAYGEDVQIFSKEEIVKQFKLYDPNIKDNTDKMLLLLRLVRELYNSDKKLYKKIKNMPIKSRTYREATNVENGRPKSSIVFIKSPIKTEYFLVDETEIKNIDFLKAAELLSANKDEKPLTKIDDDMRDMHYTQTNNALKYFEQITNEQQDNNKILNNAKDTTTNSALAFLRACLRLNNDTICDCAKQLIPIVETGTYSALNKKIKTMARKYKNTAYDHQLEIDNELSAFVDEYCYNKDNNDKQFEIDNSTPDIVITESLF